jgi:hypothetical protein
MTPVRSNSENTSDALELTSVITEVPEEKCASETALNQAVDHPQTFASTQVED